MLSPLKPLLCRHDFYWSERHRADRCRGCGKIQAASRFDALPDAVSPASAAHVAEPPSATWNAGVFDLPAMDPVGPGLAHAGGHRPSAKVLKAEAVERRENLLALLDWLAAGGQPTREDCLDALLAVIEDAHSADPVLFGPGAVDHFARLYNARGGLMS